MPRPRTGTLEHRADGYYLRVTVDVIVDGKPTTERRWIPLETHDETIAERKKAKIVAGINNGTYVAEAKREGQKRATLADEAAAYVALRKQQGKRMAPEEEGYFRLHINPALGDRDPCDVTTPDVRRMLDGIVASGRAAGTVSHARRLLHRFYKWLINTGRATTNPVRDVETPTARRDKRKRTKPEDAEVVTFLSASDPKHKLLEMKMLAISSRAAGGMRTVETIRWRWEDIDRQRFARCWIPRGKGAEAQELEIPTILAPFLRAWWERHGQPTSGPVFPVTKGKRKGEHKAERGTSFAARLRRAFLRAGIGRHELHNDTARTRRCDFHSFRRAFASAMARANVNAQQSMALTGHSDMRTHARYVVEQFTEVPAAALPAMPDSVLSTVVDDSFRPAPKALVLARHAEFESATFGFGGCSTIADRASSSGTATRLQESDRVDRTARFPVPSDDSSIDVDDSVDGLTPHYLMPAFAAAFA